MRVGDGEKFFTVGMSNRRWAEFSSWFKPRDQEPPTRPTDAVFVAEYTGGTPLVAGVCIYPTDGPFAVVERVATNPHALLRTRYEAVLFGAGALKDYAAMRNKIMLCFPSERGLAHLLLRAGFELPRVNLMRFRPFP